MEASPTARSPVLFGVAVRATVFPAWIAHSRYEEPIAVFLALCPLGGAAVALASILVLFRASVPADPLAARLGEAALVAIAALGAAAMTTREFGTVVYSSPFAALYLWRWPPFWLAAWIGAAALGTIGESLRAWYARR